MLREVREASSPSSQPLLVRTEPRDGEGLAGALLYADFVNKLDAGATATMAGRHDNGAVIAADRYPGFQYLATSIDLPGLAALLRWPLAAVEAVTLIEPLRRIHGPQVTAKSMGRPDPLRICPTCIRVAHLLRLSHGFVGVVVCSVHKCLLQSHCLCGTPLRLFGSGQDPFTCWRPGCKTLWANLPVVDADLKLVLQQGRYIATLEQILSFGDGRLLEAVRFAVRERRWSFPDGDEGRTEAAQATHEVPRSLCGIAARLAALDVSPDRVRVFQETGSKTRGLCVDQGCEYFGTGRKMRGRDKSAYRYCSHCGSRSIDGRLTSSFNLDHGSADLEATKVRMRRAEWAKWWLAVDQISRDTAHGRRNNASRTTVADVFQLAGVPTSPHLRATRLGLVWLAVRNLGNKVNVPPGWPSIVEPMPRWNHPVDIKPFLRRDARPPAPARSHRSRRIVLRPSQSAGTPSRSRACGLA